MISTVVARRYANAIFALSEKAGGDAVASHGECLAALGEMLAVSPGLEQALKSPVVTVDEKKAVLGKLLDDLRADKIMRNFCYLLADKERLACLAGIAACYGRLWDARRGVIRGRITTAVPLSAERQDEIKTSLKAKSGKDIELTFSVDKSILGGMVLQMGDRVLDASLRAQLGILRETFKRGE